ncbi:winged helix-turn-helix domain-containing protein [Rhizobium sp. BT-226]|uniref:winged helix-turn-helix domain-containing protein n=1 Tax=Rhizobium sp. BT-226 TaxID=2986922 RepID=UPI0021F71D74|nr:winged helix-turn-helix domain-containing protein [Rhizobium sp. BT-226]MBY5879832.1 winged helix-turn-helix domain-containing protein [Rhizobium leguminosarum]MCW0016257.1 winged helix-turn-helix domain-containing protein [Rhizobium sp. BT-226]
MVTKTGCFVTEGELAERIGLTLDQFKIALPGATKAGFPVPDELFANRRYWPACVAWLDRRYGLRPDGAGGPYVPDGEEHWRD